MILVLVRAIALDTLRALNSVRKGGMSPFSLRDPRVHVCSPDGSDILSYIEALINEHFGIAPTLNVPYVNSHNGHVGFG